MLHHSAPHALLAFGKVESVHPDLSVDPLNILRPHSKLTHQLPLVIFLLSSSSSSFFFLFCVTHVLILEHAIQTSVTFLCVCAKFTDFEFFFLFYGSS